jgi:hypothetical protein
MMLFIKLYPWFFSLLSIYGCWLNIKKKTSCWLVWESTAFGFSFYYIFLHPDYGSALLWMFYIYFDFVGFRQWRNDNANRQV